MKADELCGKTFGRLTVIKRCENYVSPGGTTRSNWLCKCQCGNEIKVTADKLKYGNTKSCGCLKNEITAKRNHKHGERHSRLYAIYYAMLNRCNNKKAINYKNYGGRGIKVCEEWTGEDGFKNFYKWSLDNGYCDELTIDRIDVNGNYEPSNCKWSTRHEQMNNTTRSHFITIDNVTHTLSEWSYISGVDVSTIYYRLKRGISEKEAVFSKTIKRKRGIKNV